MSFAHSNKLSSFVLLLTILGLTMHTILAVDFTDCGSGSVRQVLIQGCDLDTGAGLKGPCIVPRGRSLWFRALFVPNANYPQALTDVEAKVGSLPPIRDLEGIDRDACARYLKCPLVKETPYWINTTFLVPANLPKFRNVKVTIKLLSPVNDNQLDRVIACGQTRVSLK